MKRASNAKCFSRSLRHFFFQKLWICLGKSLTLGAIIATLTLVAQVRERNWLEADEHFGERLRHARLLQGFSQSELAVLSGKPNRQRTISRWELGLSIPASGKAIREVAEVLRVTPGFLLRGWED
jgi:hypothetical protein